MKKLVLSMLLLAVVLNNASAQENSEKVFEGIIYNRQLSVALGGGTLSYFGDLNKNSNVGMSSQVRYGFSFGIEDRLNNYFGLQLSGLYGKLSYNERSSKSNRNFESPLMQGNLSLVFYFDDNTLLKTSSLFAPYIAAGAGFVSYQVKGDLKDAKGASYYYWDDGLIKDKAQNSAESSMATVTKRDYVYETKYNAGSSLVLPLSAGLKMKLSPSLEANIFGTYNMLFKDNIDHVVDNSKNDNYVYAGIDLSYNIGVKKAELEEDKKNDAYKNIDFASLDKLDSDKDGVTDIFDMCANTPEKITVDAKGCPLDTDHDGVFDYLDKEPNSLKGAIVGSDGVTLTDSMIVAKMKRDSMAVSRNEMFNQNPTMSTLRELEQKGNKSSAAASASGFANSPEFKIADANKDSYLSVDEIMSAIDLFFEGEADLTVEKINRLIDFFFEQ